MWTTDRTSLPQWIRDAYEDLAPHFETASDDIHREEAYEILLTTSDAVEDTGDAEYALDRLLERGWLYEVDGTLRKTD